MSQLSFSTFMNSFRPVNITISRTFLLVISVLTLLVAEAQFALSLESLIVHEEGVAPSAPDALSSPTSVSLTTREQVPTAFGQLPFSFEVNQGQADSQVRFLSRGRGYTLLLKQNEAVLTLQGWQAKDTNQHDQNRAGAPETLGSNRTLHMELVDANPQASVAGEDKLPGTSNYLLGNNPKAWRTNIPTYAKVQYRSVYPGIDLVYYGKQGQLEYDFILAPGTAPQAIQLAFRGTDKIVLDPQGDLVFHLGTEEVRLRRPHIYQEIDGAKQQVAGGYQLLNEQHVGFQVASYDTGKPLIIDPVLSYSSYLGGNNPTITAVFEHGEFGEGIVVDAAGNAYVTGGTTAADIPNADNSFIGVVDTFIAKYDPAGVLVYLTYLGGSDEDRAFDIAVDDTGSVYVTGVTTSADFPTLSSAPTGALQDTLVGRSDAFIAKLTPAGDALEYSTLLGDAGDDFGLGIVVDADGHAYIGGGSSLVPPAGPCLGNTLGGLGNGNGFIAKLTPDGGNCDYMTVFGSTNGLDQVRGIAIEPDCDRNCSVYMVGRTAPFTAGDPITDFPVTPGALQSTFGGLGPVNQ